MKSINNMRITYLFVIQIVFVLFLNSCAQTQLSPHPQTDKVFTDIKAKQPKSKKKKSDTPDELSDAPNTKNHSAKTKRRFLNISVHELNAREFFMGLGIDSKENIVVHPEVKGTISLVLKNVSLAEVLDVVEKIYGYDCKKTSMGYIVYPAVLHTKVFKIDRLDLIREGRSNIQVTSGQHGNQNNQQGNNNQFGNSQQNNNLQNNMTGTGNQPFNNSPYNNAQNAQNNGSWIRTSSNTDFWEELDEAINTIISVDPQASFVINRQSGLVVVRAKPMQLNEVANFISSTQNQIGRQVILEAKIMEVILDSSHQDGVNWKVLAKNGLDVASVVTGFGVPNPAKFASVFTLGSIDGSSFSAMLELLETQGKTNVLSSPRISTLNNQKAIIKVGKDEYFVTGVSGSTVANGGLVNTTTTLPAATMASFFSGISLDVTPQIDDNQNITLHIHPSITKVENLDKTFTLYDTAFSLPTPLSTARESDSIVKAQNGQVIVLGGLMQESEVENKEGLSGLARIPYIGHLFRVDKGTTQKSELIILLKASIINDNSDWQNNLDTTQPRFEKLESRPMWK